MWTSTEGHINEHRCCAWCHGPQHFDIYYQDDHRRPPGDHALPTLTPGDVIDHDGDWITVTYYAPASGEAPPADYDPHAVCYLMGWTTHPTRDRANV